MALSKVALLNVFHFSNIMENTYVCQRARPSGQNFGVFKHNSSEEKKIMRSIQNKTPDDKNFLGV